MSGTAHPPVAPHTSWQLPDRPTVGDVVTARVRRAILEQEIRPGTRLRQTQLADALGVSRMPVRDAIQELAAEGLLHTLPAGGVMVPPFEMGEVLDALRLRGPLEAEALRGVVTRAPSLAPLSAPGREAAGLDFHRALGELSGNRFLVTALTPVWAQAERASFALAPVTTCRPDSPEHSRIIVALTDGDLTTAARTLEGHLAAFRDEVAGSTRSMPA